MLITANGTDIAGGTEALRRQYLGNQLANQTLRDAGEIYRNGMYESSERQGAAVNRSTEQAIRGQGVYVDAYGNAVRLPNYAPGQRFPGPNGARYSQGADGYWRDQYGNFLNPR